MLAGIEFLVLGVGGLGCPALSGLIAAGARRMTLVDPDRVEPSNLQRQTLFRLADVGMRKIDAARLHLHHHDSDLEVRGHPLRLHPSNLGAVLDQLAEPAVVLECTDSPALKFAVNDACLARNVDAVIGAALGWSGQALAVRRGAACYRCIFEAPPPAQLTPACREAGVIGTATGLLGHWMAALAVQLATGVPEVAGRLVSVNLRDLRFRQLCPPPRLDCPACSERPSRSTHFDREMRSNQGA